MGRGGVAGGLVGFVGVRMDTVGCHNLYVNSAARSHLFGSIQMADSLSRACMGLRHRMAGAPILEVRAWTSSFGCLTEAPCCSACGSLIFPTVLSPIPRPRVLHVECQTALYPAPLRGSLLEHLLVMRCFVFHGRHRCTWCQGKSGTSSTPRRGDLYCARLE